MAIVTGKTSAKIDELIGSSIATAEINSDGQFTLTTKSGATINAGTVGTTIVGAVINNLGRLIMTRRNGQTFDAGQAGAKPFESYPVGAIYMSTLPGNPSAELKGGTWQSWGAGRVPVGVDPTQSEFDSVEEIGGSKYQSLTVNQLPSHAHNMAHTHPTTTTSSDAHSHTIGSGTTEGTAPAVRRSAGAGTGPMPTTSDAHNHTVTIPPFSGNTGAVGNSEPHNNLQPYITCYMWKRVA